MKLDDVTTIDVIQGKLKMMDKKMNQLNDYWLQQTNGLTLMPDGKVLGRDGREYRSPPVQKISDGLASRRSLPSSRHGSRPSSRQGSRPSSRARSRSPHENRGSGYISDASRHSDMGEQRGE